MWNIVIKNDDSGRVNRRPHLYSISASAVLNDSARTGFELQEGAQPRRQPIRSFQRNWHANRKRRKHSLNSLNTCQFYRCQTFPFHTLKRQNLNCLKITKSRNAPFRKWWMQKFVRFKKQQLFYVCVVKLCNKYRAINYFPTKNLHNVSLKTTNVL